MSANVSRWRRHSRRREAQLRTLIDAMPDIVRFKDGAGRWLEANAFTIRLFGLEGVAYRDKTDAELAEYSPLPRGIPAVRGNGCNRLATGRTQPERRAHPSAMGPNTFST